MPKPSAAGGKRAVSQPVGLTLSRTFTFAAPSAVTTATANGRAGMSARERAEARAQERLKAKKEEGIKVGSGSGWGKPTVGGAEKKTREREEEEGERNVKRKKLNPDPPRLPSALAGQPGRRVTSAPSLGARNRITSGTCRKVSPLAPPLPTTAPSYRPPLAPTTTTKSTPLTADALKNVGATLQPVVERGEAEEEVRKGMEKEKRVVEYLERVQQAASEDEDVGLPMGEESGDEEEEVVALLRTSKDQEPKWPTSAPAPALKAQRVLPSTTAPAPLARASTAGTSRQPAKTGTSRPALVARRPNVDAGASAAPAPRVRVPSDDASKRPAGGKVVSENGPRPLAANFQKRLTQWREAEARQPATTVPAPRPSQKGEWQDVSLVHHVLPTHARPAPSHQQPTFGLATEKRRLERQRWEALKREKEGREEVERKVREVEEERREREEVRGMRKGMVVPANPVPDFLKRGAVLSRG